MQEKMVWFDAREMHNEDSIIQLVYTLSYKYILVHAEQYKRMNMPHKINLIIQTSEFIDNQYPKEAIILSDKMDTLSCAVGSGYKTALYRFIGNSEEMEAAWQDGREFPFLVVECEDETNIPLELLLARLQNEKTSILKIVHNAQEGEIAMKVMEKGSEGVVLSTADVDEVLKMDRHMNDMKLGELDLVAATVTSVEHIEMGHRACIDITSIMSEKEGMIIGSTSSGGLLISSETHDLPYMGKRPFRVNAGAVHSYIFTPNGTTQYMTELKSGSLVMVVDKDGNTRSASVGRVKIEVRPLLKIEAEVQDRKISSIVQDDWHIRIFGADGKVMNASIIRPGDRLLAYICEGGRHVGLKIDESLIEV